MLGTMWKVALLAQPPRDRIGIVEQPLERAFHPPFGHRLAGMLAGVEPDLQRPVADPEIIHLLAVERLAERAVLDRRMRRRPRRRGRGAAPSYRARNRRTRRCSTAASRRMVRMPPS